MALTPLTPSLHRRLLPVYVPGHGDIGNAADVLAFRGYLAYLREQVALPVKDDKSGDALLNAVLPHLRKNTANGISSRDSRNQTFSTLRPNCVATKKIPQPETGASATKP